MNKRLPDTAIPGTGLPSLGNLESLAGIVEDLNDEIIAQTDTDFEDLVRQRFGNDVSPEQVKNALNALRDIPFAPLETDTPS